MRQVTLALLFLGLLAAACGPSKSSGGWPVQFGVADAGSGSADIRSVATDSSGNVYALGLVSASNGSFITKFDPTGKQLWQQTYPFFCIGMAVDSAHSAILLACTEDNTPSATVLLNSPELVKLDLSGTLQWQKVLAPTKVANTVHQTIGGSWNQVAVDASGTIWLAGLCDSPIGTAAPAGPPTNGETDDIVGKYDSAGNFQWVAFVGTGTGVGAPVPEMGVAGDGQGNVVFTSEAAGSIDGTTYSGGSGDILTFKLSGTDGHVLWIHDEGLGGTIECSGRDVAVDASGNAYVVGFAGGALDGQAFSGSNAVVVLKYDAAGNHVWTREIGSGGNFIGLSLALDQNGLPIATGSGGSNFDGHPSSGGAVFVKYDASGNKVWSSVDSDVAAQWSAIDASGNTFVVGGDNLSDTNAFAIGRLGPNGQVQ